MAFFKNIKNILLIFLTALVLFLYMVLFRIDPSSTPINPLMTPEILSKTYTPHGPMVLLNYGDRTQVFFKNQNALVGSAADKGFNIIYSYHKGHIEPEFYHRHIKTLEQPRGAGYWLWKPYFILRTLRSLPEDAILFYADSGAVFTQPLTKLMNLLKTHDMILVTYGKPVPIRRHLKKEAFAAFPFPFTDKILNSPHIWGFFMVIKNTKSNQQLIEKWLKVAENKDALTDEPFDPKNQDSAYQGHLHDEALLGPLVAQNPERIIIIPKNILRKEYGVNHFHRQAEEEYTSPLFLVAGFTQGLAHVFWNNPLCVSLRRWLYS